MYSSKAKCPEGKEDGIRVEWFILPLLAEGLIKTLRTQI